MGIEMRKHSVNTKINMCNSMGNPLHLKDLLYKKIPRVCDSTKTAETLAADKNTDDAIYFARIIWEIYIGDLDYRSIVYNS